MRSFRVQLALRFTLAMAAGMILISVASVYTLRALLDRKLRESVVNLASIQAASVVDSPGGGMEFHEWELTPQEAEAVRELVRYAQVWNEAGQSLLRSRFMTQDLPLDLVAIREADQEGLVWREQSFQGRPILSLYYPLARYGAPHDRHILQVAAPLASREEMVGRLILFFAAVSFLVTLASAVGSWWLAGRAVRPVHEVMDQAEAIGAGSLDRRIQAWADTREYHRLVEVLNTMLARIQSGFEAQRRFTADASHELRSPLTALRGEIEIALRKERDAGEYRAVLESNLEEILRLTRMTEDLLTLARADARVLRRGGESVDLGELARGVVERFQRRAGEGGVSLDLLVAGEGEVQLDRGLLGQILWNLVDNAVKFTPRGGQVEVRLERRAELLSLEVWDTGPGLGDEPDKVFERFYRADPARTPGTDRAGTGLGLAIVQAIVETFGGEIHAANRAEGGARFTVRIPLRPNETRAAAPAVE